MLSVPAYSIYANVAFLVGGAVIVEVLTRWMRIGYLIAGAITAGLIAVLSGAIWALLVTLLFVVASFVVGRFVLAYLSGAVVYGTAAGVLARFPVNYPGLEGVHVVDGACLPSLTEKSHTLTIMANADRIGRNLARQMTGWTIA